jgi:drug/metabolite transporter (DMT)-like permease
LRLVHNGNRVTESQLNLTVLEYEPAAEEPPKDHRAALGLVLATVLWGAGFTWAKAAGEGVHRATGLPDGSMFGPVFVLAWRFLIAGVAIVAFVPAARRGWTRAAMARSVGVGVALAAGLVVQHLGLDRTSEAVSAFLTSLTILFVPLIVLVVFRKPPAPLLWAGVVVATAGIWLMTGAAPAGFGVGEVLGLACAVLFAVYILAVNSAARTVPTWQLTAGQFLVVSVLCFATCLFVDGGPHCLSPRGMASALTHDRVWRHVLLLSVFPTLGAFVLLNVYQPRLDPTRAALIYLIEPVVAAAYAWVAVGRALGPEALFGAVLILVANVLVEVLSTRSKRAAFPA